MNKWELSHSHVQKIQSTRNYCLVKDEVGKAKPTVRNLPPEWFTYGKSSGDDQEGAGIITRSWKFHTQSALKKQDIDFIKLNRVGLQIGNVSSKDFRSFRKQNDQMRLKTRIGSRKSNKRPELQQFIFGKPCRPPTPIDGVIGNLYGNIAFTHNDKLYDDKNVKFYFQGFAQKLSSIKPTKASTMAASAVIQNTAVLAKYQQEDPQLFKMTKFQNVRPRTESYSRRVPTVIKKYRDLVNEGSLPYGPGSARAGFHSTRSARADSREYQYEDKEVQCMTPYSQHSKMQTIE